MQKKSTILFIGSNGFIARNLIRRLGEEKHHIIGISKSKNDKNRLKEYYSLDIADIISFRTLIQSINADYIYHLGGIVTAERDYILLDTMLMENFFTTLEIIKRYKRSNKLKRYIYFSSTEEYGDVVESPISLNTIPKPNSPYSLVKNLTVSLLKFISYSEKFPTMVVRPSNIFGRFMNKDKFIPKIITKILKNESVELTPCQQKRDFIHIDQFLDILLILQKDIKSNYSEFNITSGISFKLYEIALIISQELHKSTELLKFGSIPYRNNEMMNYKFDVNYIRNLTNVTLTRKDIIDKLKRYINYEYEFD